MIERPADTRAVRLLMGTDDSTPPILRLPDSLRITEAGEWGFAISCAWQASVLGEDRNPTGSLTSLTRTQAWTPATAGALEDPTVGDAALCRMMTEEIAVTFMVLVGHEVLEWAAVGGTPIWDCHPETGMGAGATPRMRALLNAAHPPQHRG